MPEALHRRIAASFAPIAGRPLGMLRRVEIADLIDPAAAVAARAATDRRRVRARAIGPDAPLHFLQGEIGRGRAKAVRSFLDRHDGEGVRLMVDSNGGFVDEALEIAEAVAEHRGGVRIRVLRRADSAAALVVAAGGWREAGAGASFALHRVAMEPSGRLTAARLRRLADQAEADDARCVAFLGRHCRLPASAFLGFEARNMTLTAHQAVTAGLLDRVIA